MRSRLAPSRSIAATVFSSTPVKAPFQPAWAAPITRASASANSTGPQSAVETPMAMPGVSVTMRVGLRALAGEGLADDDHVGRMDLVGGQQMARGATPIQSATRRRFSRTLAWIVLRSGADVEALVDAVRRRRRRG